MKPASMKRRLEVVNGDCLENSQIHEFCTPLVVKLTRGMYPPGQAR